MYNIIEVLHIKNNSLVKNLKIYNYLSDLSLIYVCNMVMEIHKIL